MQTVMNDRQFFPIFMGNFNNVLNSLFLGEKKETRWIMTTTGLAKKEDDNEEW